MDGRVAGVAKLTGAQCRLRKAGPQKLKNAEQDNCALHDQAGQDKKQSGVEPPHSK